MVDSQLTFQFHSIGNEVSSQLSVDVNGIFKMEVLNISFKLNFLHSEDRLSVHVQFNNRQFKQMGIPRGFSFVFHFGLGKSGWTKGRRLR